MVKIFVGNLGGSTVTEEDLRSKFEEMGTVTEVAVKQRGGFGFVQMASKEDAERAVTTLNGTELGGTPLTVEVSRGKEHGRLLKIFIGTEEEVPRHITEEVLQKTFEQVGPVRETRIMQRGGFGFVHMEKREDAERAVSEFNGLELGGTTLELEISHGKKTGRDVEDIKIFVGNIDKEKVTNFDLKDAFGKYGTVTHAVVIGKFGFVHMNSRDDAKTAIGKLNRTDINGCCVVVMFSTGAQSVVRTRGRDGGDSDRRGGRDRRDPYYDDYYYPPPHRGGPYDRRGPPPPDPFYRGRFDPYARRPPGGDPYFEYLPPPPRAGPYGYPPRGHGYDRLHERALPPRREFRDQPTASRPRYPLLPPPPPARVIGRSSVVGGSDPYAIRRESGSATRRSTENFSEDRFSAGSQSAFGGFSGPFAPSMSGGYPGEKRPVLPSSSAYGGPPPKRGILAAPPGGGYGY